MALNQKPRTPLDLSGEELNTLASEAFSNAAKLHTHSDSDNEALLSRVSKAADGTDTAEKDMVLCQVESVLMPDPLALPPDTSADSLIDAYAKAMTARMSFNSPEHREAERVAQEALLMAMRSPDSGGVREALVNELKIAGHLRIENGRLLTNEEKSLIETALSPRPTAGRENMSGTDLLPMDQVRAIDAALSPSPSAEPVAWQPIEPTKEMAVAGRKALAVVADRMEEAKLLATSSIDFWQRVGHEPANEIYKAMVAASPVSDARGREAWQLIETAPKDGTPVLLAGGTLVAITKSDRESINDKCVRALWLNYDFYHGPYWHVDCTDDAEVEVLNPTHWQPLPVSPSFDKTGGGK